MLIDEFLPTYDVSEYHQIDIQAPAEMVYQAMRTIDLSGSTVIRWLFRLRGLPSSGFTIDGVQKLGFILLDEAPSQELLLGLIGRFWTLSGGLQQMDSDGFRPFDKPGYAKVAWNFSLSPQANGVTRLSTETRVCCLDNASRRRFRRYWWLIGPFSGLIRKKMLRAIQRQAEEQTNG